VILGNASPLSYIILHPRLGEQYHGAPYTFVSLNIENNGLADSTVPWDDSPER
jgi:hypothetical protein